MLYLFKKLAFVAAAAFLTSSVVLQLGFVIYVSLAMLTVIIAEMPMMSKI
jgi:hypothetical protein